MPFEGILVGASVTSAIAAIPGAIKNIRELLLNKKCDNSDIFDELDNLRKHIISFGGTAGWLEEIKRLHEHLQRFDETLLPIREQYSKAIASGRFVAQNFSLSTVREKWEMAKIRDLSALIAFIQKLRHIEKRPLIIGNNEEFISGPDWAKGFLDLKNSIEKKITEYDKGDDTVIVEIADNFNRLSSHVRNNMFLADERIRNEATALGSAFARLADELKNV